MADVHAPRHGVVVTQRFLEGGLAITVTIISVITIATLVYAWFLA